MRMLKVLGTLVMILLATTMLQSQISRGLFNLVLTTDSNGALEVAAVSGGVAGQISRGAGNIVLTTDSNGALEVALTGGTLAGDLTMGAGTQILIDLAEGSASDPFLAWADAGGVHDTGLLQVSVNTLGFSTAGTERLRLGNTSLILHNSVLFGWDATGAPGALDLALARNAAGVLRIASVNNTNNEDLLVDLEGTANRVVLTSSTGVVEFDFGLLVPHAEGSPGVDCTSAAAVTVINGIVTACS